MAFTSHILCTVCCSLMHIVNMEHPYTLQERCCFCYRMCSHNLFNSFVIKTDCVVSHDSMILYTILKMVWPHARYYPTICMEWLTKTTVLQLGQPLSWPGYELIMNEANQEDHFFKTLVFHFICDGAGWLISEFINPKFFRKS